MPKRFMFVVLLIACVAAGMGQGFLKAKDTLIVNGKGEPVILRGMGLGGWMLQEPYMLKLNGVGPQFRIRERISELIGPEKTATFYDVWLMCHTRKIDIDSMAAWGFNSVRLPMHYNLYTLPVDKEPVKGKNTWLEKGFALTDSLLSWCKANHMYLILDMHAAPGGQGNDYNIADRDSTKPSLWQSSASRAKLVALWRRLAERYAREPWIGGYDILNEPNWGFADTLDKHGLKETGNGPLRDLLMDITNAIRQVDKKHMIIIEGNGWGNNYRGMLPPWDDNMVLSFHKYWNPNTDEAIGHFLELRRTYHMPLWLGESGENNNTWYRECIRLVEGHSIGWSWWPLKKIGTNNPLEIVMSPQYKKLADYLTGKGPKPTEEEVEQGLDSLLQSVRLENNRYHKEVTDALFQR
jgi:cellulase (glycosyl hydrolase family 5)